MPIEFNCPNCDKLLRTKDDKAGSRANCPGCGDPITVPSAGGAAFDQYGDIDQLEETYPEPQDDYDDDGGFNEMPPPPSRSSPESASGTRACPMCGERVKAAAIRCRYCAESLDPLPGSQRPSRRPSRQRRGREGSLRATKIEVGDVIHTSWEIFKAELGMCIGGFVVSMLCHVAVIVVAVIVGLILFGVIGAAGGIQNGVAGGILGIFGLIALVVVFVLVQTFFTDGQRVFFLKIARGEQASMGDLFSGGSFVWSSLVLSFLYAGIISVGLLLCVVPGIIAIFMFWPAQMLLVDRNIGIMESLSQAKEITAGNKLALFVIMLVAGGISLLGNMVPAVGVIIAIPMVTLMMHVTYIKMTGQRTALD